MTDQPEGQLSEAQKLFREGLVVSFETIGTIHQCALFEGEGTEEETDSTASAEEPSEASLQWEVLEYGIPVLLSNENGVVLCLADVESGDKLCEFTITSSSQYVALDDGQFHLITETSGCYGISYANTKVGERIMAYLKRAVACVPPDPEPVGGARVEEDGGELEEVDGPFNRRQSKKKKKEKKERPTISEPQNFQHLSHVGAEASVGQLSEAMSWTDTLKGRGRLSTTSSSVSIPMYNCKEVETVSTASFVQEFPAPAPTTPPAPAPAGPPPPAPPPPPAVIAPPAKVVLKKKRDANSPASDPGKMLSSIAEELKKGVVLRPVGGDRSSMESKKSFDSIQEELKQGVVLRSVRSERTMTLPPPPRRNQSEQLLFEISTFRRKKLRHVSSSGNSMTDSPSITAPGDKSLESVMKRGLDKMMGKLGDLNMPNVGSVNGDGRGTYDSVFE